MIPFQDRKLVYIAVPKTGTTAVYLQHGKEGGSLYRHTPYSEVWWRFPEYKTVGVVRHPVAWVVSWYGYKGIFSAAGGSDPRIRKLPMSFDLFAQTWIDGIPFWRDDRLFQHEYLVDMRSGKRADYILPYQPDNRLLCDLLDIQVDTGINSAAGPKPVVSKQTFDAICNHAREDLALWEEACDRYGVEKVPI